MRVMTRGTQATPILWVVGVESLSHQLPTCEWVVVGVRCRIVATLRHAYGVTHKDVCAEDILVAPAIATLGGGSSTAFCLFVVGFAPAGTEDWLAANLAGSRGSLHGGDTGRMRK